VQECDRQTTIILERGKDRISGNREEYVTEPTSRPSPVRSGTGQGSNSVHVRQFNERVILAALRRMGQASKADIARHASLTNNAAGVIVRELERAGLIHEKGKKRDGGRGQPATMLSLAPEGAYGIGVRIDRRSIETVLVDFAGQPINRRIHTMDLPAPERAIDLIARDIATLVAQLSPVARDRLAGVGVAAPYNLGAWLEKLDLPVGPFRAWDDFDIASALRAATGLDVVAENDGTAAAVAELFYGHGRTIDDFLYLFIGPAIGGGVVLGGQYARGATGNAGDVAMMPVTPSRLPSAPAPANGKPFDILLSRASINALVRHLRYHGADIGGLADLAGMGERMPEAVNEWVEDCVDALLAPLLSAVSILDVPVVVIDSDLDRAIVDEIINWLQWRLTESMPEARNAPRLMRGSFGEDAGAIGAASLPLHLNFSPFAAILTGSHVMGRDDGTLTTPRREIA
jgi:predicted NBD/HSP70 family sugar kinase